MTRASELAGIADGPPLERRLAVATALATGVVIISVVVRLVRPAVDSGQPGARDALGLVGLLLAVAATCLAGLTVRRAPAVAWPSLAIAAMLATAEPVRFAASFETDRASGEWLSAAILVSLCATSTIGVAALYATRPDRLFAGWVVPLAAISVGWLVVACLSTVVLAAAGITDRHQLTPIDLVTWPVNAWIVLVGGLIALGIAGELRPAIARTRLRREAERAAQSAAGQAPGRWARPGPMGWLATLGDELVGAEAGRRAGAEAERTRLASDLHADVLPGLRHALREVEAGRATPEVAAELRALAEELEGVVTDRQDPLLDALGLVRALEALAERVEDRGGPRVELLVTEDAGTTARPPLDVEAAALRIARLAVDNAVHHAGASTIILTVRVTRTRLELSVGDDGRGLAADSEAEAIAAGRHGLADIRRLAAEAGASMTVGPGEAGAGTTIRFDWPSRLAR